MSRINKFVRVVQRLRLDCDVNEGYIIPLLEPLFMIDTHLSFDERLRLFNLATLLPKNFVACELGSYLGASTSFLAAAASLKQGHVHAVDTWRNDAMPGERAEDTYGRFLDNVEPLRNWITVHRGLAREVKPHVPRVDLLFVDGDHSYEGTIENLSDYAAKLSQGGILAMHDFGYVSVQQAISDYFKGQAIEDLGLVQSLKAYKIG